MEYIIYLEGAVLTNIETGEIDNVTSSILWRDRIQPFYRISAENETLALKEIIKIIKTENLGLFDSYDINTIKTIEEDCITIWMKEEISKSHILQIFFSFEDYEKPWTKLFLEIVEN